MLRLSTINPTPHCSSAQYIDIHDRHQLGCGAVSEGPEQYAIPDWHGLLGVQGGLGLGIWGVEHPDGQVASFPWKAEDLR
jgi:hypothetical protein